MNPCAMFAFVAVVLVAVGNGLPATQTRAGPLELIILHNNDMHARFEQTGKYSNTCRPEDVLANLCYGGFARVAYKLKEYRNKAAQGGTPVLYLNAGDTYTGTPWFTLYKEQIVTEFLNLLKPDAISLGNHEFDLGIESLVSFLNEAHFPVLVSNLDASMEPTLQSAKALKKSTTFNVNGVNVGVIGYLTPETKTLADGDNRVVILDEIEAINKESAILKANGVNIIIALGHSGLDVDKLIAEKCNDVDVVIGGHSHTFLYTGTPPDAEVPVSTYPVIVQRGGRQVPVVQAYAFTKYLGYLHLSFDANGNLLNFDGTPILLDGVVPRDPDVLTVLEKYRPGITALQTQVVGRSVVHLNGTCRFNECNVGNFITDAMVFQYARDYEGDYWTDAAVALLQSGGIRTSLDIGNVTMYDLTTLLPFESNTVTIDVTGAELKDALEHSVYRYDGITGFGEFLQMSGIHVTYNLTKPPLQRVESASVLCTKCNIPAYYPLDLTSTYKIILSSFLQLGGDGFSMLMKPATQFDRTEQDSTRVYLNQLQVIYPPVEWRITLKGISENNPSTFNIAEQSAIETATNDGLDFVADTNFNQIDGELAISNSSIIANRPYYEALREIIRKIFRQKYDSKFGKLI